MKKGAGRPTKKTDDRLEILRQCLEEGMPLDRACDYAQIDPKTPLNWAEKDSEFSAKLRFWRAAPVRTLVRLLALKDPFKLLRALDPKNFNDEMTFHMEHREPDEEMEKKSDEEIDRDARGS
jgi:hypothetical protein